VILKDGDTLREIRKHRFDTVVDFMHSAISGYYTLFSGASRRIAFYRPWGFWCYNSMPKYRDIGYTVTNRLQILSEFGIKSDGILPDMKFGPENEKRALEFMSRSGIKENDFTVSFDITSKRDYKSWPGERFARLADMIADRTGARVIFTYAPNEAEYVRKCLSLCRRKHILSFPTGLADLAALVKRCGLHIGTSSAPGHIAVSQGVPTFTIYGMRTDPVNWTFPDVKRHGYIRGDLGSLTVEDVACGLFDFIGSSGIRF
jgi:heptosyltransferase-2